MFLCQIQEPVEVGGLPKKAFLPQLSGSYSAEAERKKFEPKRMFRKISLYKQKLINNESLGLRLLKLFENLWPSHISWMCGHCEYSGYLCAAACWLQWTVILLATHCSGRCSRRGGTVPLSDCLRLCVCPVGCNCEYLLLATAHYCTWCTMCIKVLPPGGLALI